MARTHTLERIQEIPRPCAEVFAFFASAKNLTRLTPPFVPMEFRRPPPDVLEVGTLIDYRLRLYGVSFDWQTRIESMDRGRSFSDSQVIGPYRRWHHLHEFAEAPGGGTRMRDVVTYELPLGPLGELARWLMVRRQLDAIFDYRQAQTDQIFRT